MEEGVNDGNGNENPFPTPILDNKGSTTMDHNSSKDMGNDSIPAKDRSVCLKERDSDIPSRQEVWSFLPKSHRPL